jgi:hypothetical protein
MRAEPNPELVLIADTYHSGTMFDLPLIRAGGRWNNHTNRKLTIGSKALAVGGCTDSQFSMCDICNEIGFGGSLTVALLECPNVLEEVIHFKVGSGITMMERDSDSSIRILF